MKDSQKPCQHTLSDDVIYKEVVVIGNGPSGMVTSFMLAGNVPYLKKVPADLPIDDMLRARLENIPEGQSLYEVDLTELAEGLEGRSQNPIPLLMDNLLRPCADLGIQADSLIEWQYDVEKQIDHIVLGRGPPGGAWHTFPPAVLTLSPAGWLSLPPHAPEGGGRLPARAVANYCRRYVQKCKIQRYFRSGVIVSGVTAAPRAPAHAPAPLAHRSLQPDCLECGRALAHSYLLDTFDYSVCDECRDDAEAHALVTRTEAKEQYLLKDCDLDKRSPALRCVRRRNPHRAHYSDMRLYLRAQVAERALQVWGSEAALEAERAAREERRLKAAATAERRRLRELRLAARSSLVRTRGAAPHQHAWEPERLRDAAEDLYERACTTCGHVETYEKM
ncbi:uncharacterized protein [Choristoneura fumiferana]|uniref:uncharacterized protein n=1 Tax=Choristoneura fumiferana TaxID=7141 RepID=UPI003D15E99A